MHSAEINLEKVPKTKYRVVPGYKFLLINPWELVIKDPSSNLIIVKDDNLKEPVLQNIMKIIKKGEFTLEELLMSVNQDKHSDVMNLFNYLLRNNVIVKHEEDIVFGVKRKINAIVVSNLLKSLAKRIISEYQNILNISEVFDINGHNSVHNIIDNIERKLQHNNIDILMYIGIFQIDILENINEIALKDNLLTLPVIALSHKVSVIGPLVIPGRTACLREFTLWLMNSEIVPEQDNTLFVKSIDSFSTGDMMLYKPLEQLIIGFTGEIIIDTIASLDPNTLNRPSYAGKAIFIDIDKKIISTEYVMKIPGCDACSKFKKEHYADPMWPLSLFHPRFREPDKTDISRVTR